MAEPSEGYAAQVERIKEYHKDNKVFAGNRTRLCWPSITALCHDYRAKTLLDYGCGKGAQWKLGAIPHSPPDFDPAAFLGVTVTNFDPGVPGVDIKPPEGSKFDGVICVDVLEYVPDADIVRILDEMFAYSSGFVFINFSCRPSEKECRPNEPWTRIPYNWLGLLLDAGEAHPSVHWYSRVLTSPTERTKEIVAGYGRKVVATGIGQSDTELVSLVRNTASWRP